MNFKTVITIIKDFYYKRRCDCPSQKVDECLFTRKQTFGGLEEKDGPKDHPSNPLMNRTQKHVLTLLIESEAARYKILSKYAC